MSRHRAEDITLDITVENVLAWRWHERLSDTVAHTGHLGTTGRHETLEASDG